MKRLILGLLLVSSTQAMALPNFKQYQHLNARKLAFIHYLLPLAEQVNAQILRSRSKLLRLEAEAQAGALSYREKQWLNQIADRYRIPHWNTTSEQAWQTLLRRVDIVPVSLLLAQSAKESAWGTSRFAISGNNLFGQWCFHEGCGIVPERRAEGSQFEVKQFSSVINSIRAYVRNLNINRAYRQFRTLRSVARKAEDVLSGLTLAKGLQHYSQQGEHYVTSVLTIISHNHLDKYDDQVDENI